ncbi:MAG: serine hydrolase family protein, partial [Patescibacteria group bacterium]|nr:serine hydrolase family protein [Patescibacteria group bacterium]
SHAKAVDEADLKYPIDIYFNKGKWIMLDGVHRFTKAVRLGHTTIKVRRVSEEIAQATKKSDADYKTWRGDNKPMKRVFIVHGWGGSPFTEWIPWLRTKLDDAGYSVFVPEMPNSDVPEIVSWVSHLAQVVGRPDKDTYFIGHSVGCQTILRYLQTIDTPVGGAIFVAGWFNLENLESDELSVAEPWVKMPMDIERIRKVLPKSVLIISDNDEYGAFKENTGKFGQFVSHTVVLPNAGHITQREEPAILSQFENLIQKG